MCAMVTNFLIERSESLFLVPEAAHTMAHANFEQRRQTVAQLARYHVAFDRPVVKALATAFCCSPQAIQRDLRVVQSEAALRARLDSLRCF
jgi:hypothetical protein